MPVNAHDLAALILLGFFIGVAIALYWVMPVLAGLFVVLITLVLLLRQFPRSMAFVIGFFFGIK